MNGIIIFLIVIQFIATAIGAYFLAKQARSLRIAVSEAAAIAFVLPFALYMIPFSLNPTTENLNFFIEWLIYSWIATFIAGIPAAIISQAVDNFC